MSKVAELPRSVQEIAEVIGVERSLYLVGQLPRCYAKDSRWPNAKSAHVILYIPKQLTPDHPLVSMIGWHDASRLAEVFGGEILQPGSCAEIYRHFRDKTIVRMLRQGIPSTHIAELMGLSDRQIRNLARAEIPQEDGPVAKVDTPGSNPNGVSTMNKNLGIHTT